MKTQRAGNVIQIAGKQICEYSNGSVRTDSSEKAHSKKDAKKSDMDIDIEAITTKFTTLTSGESVKNKSLDIEMELEHSTGFSFDSEMTSADHTVHSKFVKLYGNQIIKNLKQKEMVLNGNLDKHEIKSSHRKQMVVWMEEVLRIFKCPTEVFFLATSIMDRYLEGSKTKLILDDLHEIGIVSMFIASKYVEVEPLTLDLMITKVGHGKISEKSIMKTEKKILSVLKFKLAKPTVCEFLEAYVELFSDKFESDEMKKSILDDSIVVAKNGITDRKVAFSVRPSETALCSLIIAIKDRSRRTKKVILDEAFSQAIKSELTSEESVVLQFGKRLRKLALEKTF